MFKVNLCNISSFFIFLGSLIFFLVGLLMKILNFSVFMDWVFLNVGTLEISYILLFDWISFFFMGLVLLISSSVVCYSGEYMKGEYDLRRFILLMVFFILSMNMLILSPNLLSILLGWDGLGLVSYCLVIYYQNMSSLNAGMVTLLMNRLGDVFLIIGIGWMIYLGDWGFFCWLGDVDYMYEIVALLVILASMTKSAQIPFSCWLPLAMAAPTPVSALVHSSTLVTAGVYLVYRFSINVIDIKVLNILMFLSVMTMFMAGVGANYEWDLKKVIALSTLSQLGFMMYSLSMGMVMLAYFHLLIHALFKALLFMSAGCIIHGVGGWQDMRCMGGLISYMPWMSSCMVVSLSALSGIPFLAGFYSKDMVLEVSLMSEVNLLIMLLVIISTFLTVIYSLRMVYYVILCNCSHLVVLNLSDGSGPMVGSSLFLVVGSILGGSMMSWVILDPKFICLNFFSKLIIFLIVWLSLWIMFIMVKFLVYEDFSLGETMKKKLFSNMWFLSILSFQMTFLPFKLSKNNYYYNDHGWSEELGGYGSVSFFSYFGNVLNKIQLNSFNMFMYMLMVWLILLMFMDIIN